MNKQAIYNAAIYCRLSSDDGQVGESGSIQTQKTLLTQYCREHNFLIVDEYCDDGWSGTNFERPEFKRMIADIDAGKINLVVVKDLSRFGREYAQMGLYIEHYFEANEIRFIAVGEGIDTINGTDNILMPITNVINSLYAKDCSRKTIAAHYALARAGKFIGSRAPFGYMKDPNDRHHLIIDPPAADVVLHIFNLFSEGVGYVRLTKILREEKVLNPQAYFNQNNPDYYKSDYWRKPFDWHATSVRVILSNPVYLGKTVFGRTKNKGFYEKKRTETPEEDWIVVDGTHEPIIAQNTWDIVQQLMKSKRRETKKGEIQMFAGLVKCGGCGSSLSLNSTSAGVHKDFTCWVYKNYGKQRCTSHAIGYKTLYNLVLEDIRRNASVSALAEDKYIEMLTQNKSEQLKKELDKQKRQRKSVCKRIAELDKILNKLFEDNALGRINEQRYLTMSNAYETEQTSLKEKLNLLNTAINSATQTMGNTATFIHLIQKYTDIQELNTHILNELIGKIVVHEKAVDKDGVKNQLIEIHYKYIGIIPMQL